MVGIVGGGLMGKSVNPTTVGLICLGLMAERSIDFNSTNCFVSVATIY